MTVDRPPVSPRNVLQRTFGSTSLAGVGLAYLVASIGAVLFVTIGAPLPIFLGALSFAMIASIGGAPVERPGFLSVPMRIVLGVAVGSAFSPALLGRAEELAMTLALIIPFSVAITAAGTWFYHRIAGFDLATAFFSSVPGGLNDMVSMAEDAGANQRIVTLVQSVRLTLIVFLVPIWLALTEGAQTTGGVINTIHIWEMALLDLVVLAGLGVVGWWVALKLGIAGAAIVGPMILSGVVHALGWTTAKVPTELLILAQLTLGLLLGAQFRGLTMREFTSWLWWGLVFSVVLTAVSIAVAIGVAAISGADEISVLLAYAPGGQSELNLLAIILHLDVAFIALHHLVRVAAVIIGAQIVFMMHPTWQKRDQNS
ncbi:MAG: AbrB family transcriptional regulator [Pseudomonadota bacterium]